MNLSIKHRPKSLREVRGHNKIVEELKKRSKEDNFPQVMMFSGKTGTGKTSLSKIVSKNILCLTKDEAGNCCNKCSICLAIDFETITSYYFEYNASNLGIDDMRSIEEKTRIKNLGEVQKKVIVIDELQELSSNKKAQKNILKLLEKQFRNTYFILGTMDDWKVEKAIKDRSVIYRLKDLKKEDILDYLLYICDQEKVKVEDVQRADVLVAVAGSSGGSLRAAISFLERIIYSNLWEVKELENELGLVTEDKLASIVNGLLSGNITILENRITKELLEKINNTLNLYYKYKSGLKVRNNIINYIGSDLFLPNVSYVINRLNELFKYNYLTTSLIEFVIIDIINYIKIEKEKYSKVPSAEEEPKKRRRRMLK